MATFIVSTVYKKGLFGCSISTIDEKIENPESINEYAMKAKLLYEAKSKISKNIYTDSILRNIDTVGSITDTVDRFSVEFGVLAAIKFLDGIVDYGDTIIISGTPYVRELARGALEIVEAFEADLIATCYSRNVLFTNNLFGCKLRANFDNVKVSQYMIANPDDFRWIKN